MSTSPRPTTHSPEQPSTGCHCSQLSFTLNPGATHNFPLPAAQSPVRIDVSFTLLNGGTQEPSELMCAVVNQDPSSKQVTWIGTNNDGTTSGSSSLKGKAIAHIFGGASPTINATLEVINAATGTLGIAQNSGTTALPGHYIVKMYF